MEFLLCQPIPHDSLFSSSWTLSPKKPFSSLDVIVSSCLFFRAI